jgi:hypothetical protein
LTTYAKPGVENAVLQACRWLLAPLRHRQFFSLAELNQAIALLLGELNDKLMAPPREGSRRSLFEAVERGALKPLQNSVQNFLDSGGKQRPIVSTLVHAIIRRFCRRIWGVVHGYDCRDPAPSSGQQGEHQLDSA